LRPGAGENRKRGRFKATEANGGGPRDPPPLSPPAKPPLSRRPAPSAARRFYAAALDAIDALQAMPDAAPPTPTSNPRLAGLRSWPVNGFDEFWIYYLARPELLTVVRALHSKRDIGTILKDQEPEEP
jgi:toxin ParE1/3/4